MPKCITLSLIALLVTFVPAFAFEGDKSIVLIGADNQEVVIGRVTFTKLDNGSKIDVKLDESQFVNKFLSMRPFQCIDGKTQSLCHLVYPYKTHKMVTADDMTDLEYELLFLHKKPGEYGINAWNGIYYDLTKGKDGRIHGVLMETDMNVLAVPPETEYARPIADLTKGQASQHLYPRLEIR